MVPHRNEAMKTETPKALRKAALEALCAMIQRNASPVEIARFVVRSRVGIYLSHMIEHYAFPGTLAERVFDVLESGESL